MSTCVIFGSAGFSGLAEPIDPSDFVIAADGGLVYTQSLGISPNEILGDFDSLGYVPQNSRVFPVEKDDTDSMLAVRRGLELGFTRFVLYGGMDGKRLDHTVANYQTLQFLADRGAVGYLVGLDYIASVVKDGAVEFSGCPRGDFAMFCMGRDARGVTARGLYYECTELTLTAGFPLGVSNHFTGKPASVAVRDGSLLLLWSRPAGFPNRR